MIKEPITLGDLSRLEENLPAMLAHYHGSPRTFEISVGTDTYALPLSLLYGTTHPQVSVFVSNDKTILRVGWRELVLNTADIMAFLVAIELEAFRETLLGSYTTLGSENESYTWITIVYSRTEFGVRVETPGHMYLVPIQDIASACHRAKTLGRQTAKIHLGSSVVLVPAMKLVQLLQRVSA